MKVGQSLMVKRQLSMEKQLKEKMIHSVMPPKVIGGSMSVVYIDRPRVENCIVVKQEMAL